MPTVTPVPTGCSFDLCAVAGTLPEVTDALATVADGGKSVAYKEFLPAFKGFVAGK